ncbi:uncharacterized protein LOC123312424 [Coccinella septempunctata]|uniref:uncharacterized protein LOC123311538 n=1 Tax=Coccinella septempunctata TaxID=41139 RepID=UPI001D0756FE|nr:uncharacterized protein LOC123311538 [Coccinella septempunctata]XP_044752788.1 uncharacterized protein LOC123312424 [Coccinella septempunctata]
MFKEEYIRGVTGLLEDEETYKPLNKDPTKKIQDKVNNKLKEMRTAGLINEIEYRTLIRHNSVIPKLYCLRKTHKDTLSLRPIVSNINAPTYNLGKLMHDILSKVLSTSPYNVKNSIQAKEIIKNIVVPKGYILISLDVVSLFTNISKDLVIRVAHKRWNYIKNFTTLDKATFISLIELCFEGGYFSFNNKFYQQLNGTAMGAPASTSFANLVMNDLFDFVCDRLTFRILLMLLYVDDTLMLIPLEMRQTIFDLFNSYHPSIKFTIEDENENKIPFLDLLITREETNLTTCWYTKTINSNRIINYYSNHSNTQKVNTAISLMYRALSLSDSKFREETTQKVCKILRENNYPKYIIQRVVNKAKEKVMCTRNNIQQKNKETTQYCRFPFIPGLSQKISRIFKRINCTCAFYNKTTTKKYFTQLKDSVPTNLQSSVVYNIPCSNCDKAYIGQTKQLLKDRIRQHKTDSNNITHKEKTALTSHTFKEGHKFNFEETTILDHENNNYRRNISEMIHITLNKTVNYREDVNRLSTIYNSLLVPLRK